MAKKTVGDLIKEARTNAGLTQEQLARKVENVSAGDIGKAERGEKSLTQAALKQIAKATGVTQKSLLDAAAGEKGKTAKSASAAKSGSAAKTAKSSSSKTSTAKTAKSSSAKTSTAKAAKSSSSKTASTKLTAAEKKFLELYRKADADTKKAAEEVLKGEKDDANLLQMLFPNPLDILARLGKR